MAKSERLSRAGQAWRSVPEVEEIDHPYIHETKARVVVGFHHFTGLDNIKHGCSCSEIVRVDSLGYAFCARCGQIYNDYMTSQTQIQSKTDDYYKSIRNGREAKRFRKEMNMTI
jgi:hypothetical protein